ncbi:MAG: aminotransferase class III-fold pyridoxal phosphate-dependent enzyme [Gammaproteobacteria bacterium]|nr:aminotransferase class III-fold pyridoxal phosphate-dependent enzyme [Gammaproteobacteria bacterium]
MTARQGTSLPLRALGSRPPDWDPDALAAVARQHFNVRGEPHPLGGERDQNLRMLDEHGAPVVVKLSGIDEGRDALALQTAALRHIARVDPDLNVPRVVISNRGEDVVPIGTDKRIGHYLRVLTWLPGESVESLGIDSVDAGQVGGFVSRLGRSLAGFSHPSSHQETAWNLTTADRLSEHTHCFSDSERHKLVEVAFDIFLRHGLARLGAVRAQVVHNDTGPANLLADSTNPGGIGGVFDFGDMTHGPRIVDPVISAVKIAQGRPAPVDICARLFGGYSAHSTLDVEEVELLFPAMMGRIALTTTIQAWREVNRPTQAHLLACHMDALFRDLETYLTEGKDRVTDRFSDAAGVPCGAGRNVIPPPRERDAGKLLERRRKVLGPALHLTYERPLHAVRGDGVWIYDENGQPHLDAYNNVPHVGHAHPRIADAISRQSRLINTNTRYLHDEVVEYAERLTARCPDSLEVCVFVNSGSEATDVAWRIAREWNGHEGVLVMEDAYHGCTHATAELSPLRWPTDSGPPHVRCLAAPDTYRGRWPAEAPDAAARFAEDADRKIADLNAAGFKLAALVVDTAFCTNGMPDVPEGYLATVAERVRAAGGLVIADEVQYGFGRPGDRFWGFELHGLVPDLVVLGKPAANGMPLGAVVTRSDVLQRFRDRHHLFSTFGGNPVVTAAAMAVMDVIDDEDLQTNARETGAHLRRGLEALMREHDVIGRVSGQGLFCIVDVVEGRETKRPHPALAARIQNTLREERVLVGLEGRHDNFLKIRPPMPFGPNHADLLHQAMERALTIHGRR